MSDESDSAPTTVPATFAATSKEQISSESSTDLPLCISHDPLYSQQGADIHASTSLSGDIPVIIQGHPDAASATISDPQPPGTPQAADHGGETMSLTELAYLRRLQRYHGRKRNQAEQRLQICRTSWTVRNRLIWGQQRIIEELSKALRFENQKAFMLLFQAFHTTEIACQDHDRTDCPMTLDEALESPTKDHCVGPFLDRLPESSCDVLLHFLRKIAFDPDFLLRHLSCLSNREFDALLKTHMTPDASVLRGDIISQSTAYRDKSKPGLLDPFLDFGRHDLLSLLIDLVRSGSEGKVDDRVTLYWAKICAGLLSQQRPGADKFVVAIMDAWSTPERHDSSSVLENWFLEILRDGDFLLEKPDKYSFRMRVQSQDGMGIEDTTSTDAFFVRAMNSLLEILRDGSLNNSLPQATLELGRAIANQLRGSASQFQAAPYFLCSRWLVSSHLINLIKSPERFGMLLTYHISSNARRKILDELAIRLQRLAFDVAYTWKHSAAVDAKLLDNMHAVFMLFRPGQQDIRLDMSPSEYDIVDSVKCITLCPSEMITLIDGLFPSSMLDLGLSAMAFEKSTIHSSASSMSGFSIFKNNSIHDSPMVSDWTQTGQSPDVYKKTEDELLIAQLRAVCSDLSAAYGIGPASTYRDPFEEPWASVAIYEVASAPSDDSAFEDGIDLADARLQDNALSITESDGIPSHVQDAIYSVLDRFLHNKPNHKQRTHRNINMHTSHVSQGRREASSLSRSLLDAFREAAMDCRKQGDFAKVPSYHVASNHIKMILRLDRTGSILKRFIHRLVKDAQRSIDVDSAATDSFVRKTDAFKLDQNYQHSHIQAIKEKIYRLREKMWYINSVRFTSCYEDLLKVTSALRTMGVPSRSVPETGQGPSLRRRPTVAGFRDGFHLKTESAILDLLSASTTHGGPNKLSDKQIKLTSDWLQSQGIEVICKGEERLHRFCQEVSRCVDYLVGDSVVEHPTLWSSELFKDHPSSWQHNQTNFTNTSTLSSARTRLRSMCSHQRQQPQPGLSHGRPIVNNPIYGSSHAPSLDPGSQSFRRTSFGLSGSCSPTLTSSTSDTLWSTFTIGDQTMSSATSLPSHTLSSPLSDRSSYGSLGGHHCDQAFLHELRHNVTGLLLSDLGQLYHRGSETDMALWGTFDGKFAKRVSSPAFSKKPSPSTSPQRLPDGDVFAQDFLGHMEFDSEPELFCSVDTFRELFHTFQVVPSPFQKLKILCQVQDIYQASLDVQDSEHGERLTSSKTDSTVHSDFHLLNHVSALSDTSNDRVIAGFGRLFRDRTIRPSTLFRDLQFIASLVPTAILDTNTKEGHAFWNATIAALSLKQDVIRSMIETADAIVAYHTLTRGHSVVASAAQAERDSATFTSSRPNSAAAMENVSQYGMSDAAQLYLIAAKEGDPVAQRELATLYLTHPEMMKRVILPMVAAGDVFKGAAADALKGRKNSGSGVFRGHVDGKYDPVAMAIARHWMELAAKGGDVLAQNTLKATDEIERIP